MKRMKREMASSLSCRPNRSNQQASCDSLKIFEAADLDFFELTTEDANEARLRRAYFKKSLTLHPDKGGNTDGFK